MADGHGRGEQALIELAGGILVHVGKHMGVGVQSDAHIGMTQTMLDYSNISLPIVSPGWYGHVPFWGHFFHS